MGDLKARIAKRAAQEFHDGDVVNLGIGLPTMCTSYLPEGVDIILQSENGFTGLSGKAEPGKEDYRVIDSGGNWAAAMRRIVQDRKIPMAQPIMHSTTASIRNWRRIFPRVAPMALRMPISRVRSVTVTSMMFMMPIPPTTREMPAIPPSRMESTEVMLFIASSITFMELTE